MRRWKRGYNSCSRTDLEFVPVVAPRRHEDRLLTTTATVKSCQSSIMSTGGHSGRPAMSSSATSSASVVRDSRRIDLTKPRGSDYLEASFLMSSFCAQLTLSVRRQEAGWLLVWKTLKCQEFDSHKCYWLTMTAWAVAKSTEA